MTYLELWLEASWMGEALTKHDGEFEHRLLMCSTSNGKLEPGFLVHSIELFVDGVYQACAAMKRCLKLSRGRGGLFGLSVVNRSRPSLIIILTGA